jgi:hypothetical protein
MYSSMEGLTKDGPEGSIVGPKAGTGIEDSGRDLEHGREFFNAMEGFLKVIQVTEGISKV